MGSWAHPRVHLCHVECGPYQVIYKTLHENECDVEAERSLCVFAPRKPYSYALFETFKCIPEKIERGRKKEGALSLKYMVVQLSCVCVMTVYESCGYSEKARFSGGRVEAIAHSGVGKGQ